MFIIRSARVLLPTGVRPASILVSDGRIAAIRDHADRPPGIPDIDAGERMLIPGLVDSHVHINEPGRTEWEGFASATRAAAAGGVTTLVDMPLNSIPAVTSVAGLEAKWRAARGQCHVDVAFWGGVVPGNAGDLEPLAAAGVSGFKCFLSPSGVAEFAHVAEEDLRTALPIIARLRLPLLVHAELPALLADPDSGSDPRSYGTWLASRPPAAEHGAIDLLVGLAREHGAHIHVVHVASGGAVQAIAAARAEGLPVTAETCPHYLTFAAEDIADGATAWKCAPPIRERIHREQLWQAVGNQVIGLIATDHSPAPPALKRIEEGDFLEAWGGIASLQLGLAAVWTGAAERGLSPESIVHAMSEAPARLAGLDQVKGGITLGRDADLAVWDPEAETVVEPAALQHRHPVTPYAGLRLRGRIDMTMLRGEIVFDGHGFGLPRGRCLPRPRPGGPSR